MNCLNFIKSAGRNSFFWVLLLATACNSGEDPRAMEKELSKDHQREDQASAQLSQDIVDDLIHAIPSPVEMTSLIRYSGAAYNEEMLHPTNGAERYTSNFKKALNLGVYGADLGYMNIYEKSNNSISQISVVRDLADGLKVGQFFDFSTLRRLASSTADIDSVIYITTKGFSEMDSYLREQKRGNISVLIASGTWLEGMYIATQVASESPNEELIERIGEQKEVLDKIVKIVEVYKADPDFEQLLEKMQGLKSAYDEVTITHTYAEPTSKEIDGVLVIEDNSTSEVKISPETVEEIKKNVADIRKHITG